MNSNFIIDSNVWFYVDLPIVMSAEETGVLIYIQGLSYRHATSFLILVSKSCGARALDAHAKDGSTVI